MAGVKGMKHRRSRTVKERDLYARIRIEEILDAAREGDIELTPARLKAIEIAYSRVKPTLSAIEQTNIDPRDKADPAELKRQLVAMFDANPSLFDEIQALRAAASTQQQAQQSTEQRVTH